METRNDHIFCKMKWKMLSSRRWGIRRLLEMMLGWASTQNCGEKMVSRLMTQLINNIYETGEWPKDFIEVTMIGLKKKPEATKYIDHRAVSLITHTAKTVVRILRRRTQRKMEGVLEEDQFGFTRGKGTREVIGMQRIISE
jgi:hypothetical protein